MHWMWAGLRIILREVNRSGSYAWMRLLPLIECISSPFQGYHLVNLEPNIMTRIDCEARFEVELGKLVDKYKLLYLQPAFTSTQLLMLHAFIRNAPRYAFGLGLSCAYSDAASKQYVLSWILIPVLPLLRLILLYCWRDWSASLENTSGHTSSLNRERM